MPAPQHLATASFVSVWNGTLAVAGRGTIAGGRVTGGATKTRTFRTYVEVSEQGAHDPAMRSLAQSRGLAIRPMHRGRVSPANNGTAATAANYYAVHGQIVAGLVSDYMTERWTHNTTNNTVFVRGAATLLGIQSDVQANGFSYEITMWYDVADVYAAFHCYSA